MLKPARKNVIYDKNKFLVNHKMAVSIVVSWLE